MEKFEIENSFQKLPLDNKNKITLTLSEENQIIEWKKCIFYLKNIKYILLLEYQTDKQIYFYIKQDSDTIDAYYMKNFESSVIKNILDLEPKYDNPKIIFDFFDVLLDKEEIKFEKDDSRKEMRLNLNLKRETKYFRDSEYHIRLVKYESGGNKIFEELFSVINKEKEDYKGNITDINNLIKQNKLLEERVKQLEEKINDLLGKNYNKNNNNEINISNKNQININNEINQTEKNINEIKLESKEEIVTENNENKIPQKSIEFINFTGDPKKLRCDYCLSNEITKIYSEEDELNNFDTFIGMKDQNYYLVYGNWGNLNIEIFNIFEQKIIKSLYGHYARISVIKYYLNNIKEEYILSCDVNSKAIIWDVVNDYSVKYILRMSDTGIIKDAILLFGVYNNNYLVISRNKKNEFTKLYELTKDTPYIRDIYISNKNITYKIIPWKQNNIYYIIELCKGFITIKYLLEDKTYTNFQKEKDDIFLSGFLNQDNKLVANISNKNTILILDLPSKTKERLINYPYSCNSICYWSDKYIIVLGMNILFFDYEKPEVEEERVDVTNILLGVKKIKSPFFGEALVVVDGNKNILIYSLFNK